jgi:hypothetical protein
VAPRKKKEEKQRKCKGLFFGPPKHGKTHLIGTAAFDERTAPCLGLDFEGGMVDVLETMPGWGTDFLHHPVRSWEDFNEAYVRLDENDEGINSFALDSLSETHIFALMYLGRACVKGSEPRFNRTGRLRDGPRAVEAPRS